MSRFIRSECSGIFKMYIAFRWLIGLTLAMWIAMCIIDIFLKRNKEITTEDFHIKPLTVINIKNRTEKINSAHTTFIPRLREKHTTMACIFMFLAGALFVSTYQRLIISYFSIKRKLASICTRANAKKLQECLKITIIAVYRITTLTYLTGERYLGNFVSKSIKSIRSLKKNAQIPKINAALVTRIKGLEEERKYLTHLLLATIQENKNLKMQYQLENMAKIRLERHKETTQSAIKENRSRYARFQQQYLVIQQENIFLKSRLKKLMKEKEEALTNLFELLNEIYISKNNDLKAYCSRFIVKTKDNLLNTDVGAEVNAFLNKASYKTDTDSSYELSGEPVHDVDAVSNCLSSSQITESFCTDSLSPTYTEEPKQKGLAGYVWTVNDRDGLIEKLYEYDCETDLKNGDTIRRVREYSVYFDKDCLLDVSNSSTFVNEKGAANSVMKGGVEFPVTSQRFLTGSEAFRKFMENNKNIVSTSVLSVSPLSM